MSVQKTTVDRNARVTVKEAVYSREDRDTRTGKDGKGAEVRLSVLCDDRCSRLMWFEVKDIHQLAGNRMLIPVWLLERKNKYLRAMKLVFAKIQLDYGKGVDS